MEIRTRFAPSPTGFLHIGSLRGVLYTYAWAKKHHGTFILRIEDTDRARLVEGAIQQITESMKWVGLVPTEGVIEVKDGKPVQKGEYGPYIQSERLETYNKYAQQLLDEGKAYKCFCTSERLDEMRAVQRAAKQMPKYDRKCYHLSEEEKNAHEEAGDSCVVRFLVPEGGPVAWKDAVFGDVSFERDQVDDFIMIKADTYPTYNFAVVIDDHLMNISHVLRGDEFISSTPKHLLVYEAFGWDIPTMVHLPPILGKGTKKKLSKRDDDVSVDSYKEKGFLPQAMVNYLSLQGWNPKGDQDIFSLDELVDKFDLKDIQKSGAVFDYDKLLWMNGQYIKELSVSDFTDHCLPYLSGAGILQEEGGQYRNLLADELVTRDQLESILKTEQQRTKLFNEIPEKINFFFQKELSYNKEILLFKKMTQEQASKNLEAVLAKLEVVADEVWTDEDKFQLALREVVEETGEKVGEIFYPVRAALSGLERSPGPQEIAVAIGKEKSLDRIRFAISL